MNRAVCAAVCVVGVLTCGVARMLSAQGARAEPMFDVASVKPLDSSAPRSYAAFAQEARQFGALEAARQSGASALTLEPGGRWLVRAATLTSILQAVYPAYSRPGLVGTSLIVGGPAWVDSQYFEIDARAPADSTPEDIELMARRLLADRFKLQVSTAIRPLSVYVLTVTRDDKRLGPGMRPPIECEQKPKSFGTDGMPVWGAGPRCRVGLGSEGGVLLVSGGAAPISQLIFWLQPRVDRMIVDRTGLAGNFAIRLEVPRSLPAEPGTLATGPSDMITAVREQLGLSLVPRTEPTPVLMIDHVEMPTPN